MMKTLRAYAQSFYLSEELFYVVNRPFFVDTVEHVAVADWLRFHDIDPNEVPFESEIRRDTENHRVYYDTVRRDETGMCQHVGGVLLIDEVFEQGEAGPLPFPRELFDCKKMEIENAHASP